MDNKKMDLFNIDNDNDEDNNDELLLKTAKERFKIAEKYWDKHQKKTTELLKFVAGDQWDTSAREAFEQRGYAAITDNVIPSFVRQITNELRKSQPEIVFNPLENADSKKADILNDLVRNIQLESKSDIAYDSASWMAAVTGLGFWRVVAEYENELSFNQKLSIQSIDDPNSVFLDPSHKSSSGSDAEWCFIIQQMSKDEYKRLYSDSKLSNLDAPNWTSQKGMWLDDDKVVVAEYFYKDYEDATLFMTYNKNSGKTEISTDVPDQTWVDEGVILVLQTRPTKVPVVHHCKLNAVEVLESTIFPGTILPVVCVKGDEIYVENERQLIGAVEPAVDSQVMLNYYLSLQAQIIQMAPKAPYIGTATQFKGYEQEWADINVSGQAFATYNSDPTAPPPSRDLGEVPIQSMALMCNQARENLKQIFGIYDASLGMAGNETSGKAILARQEQSGLSNYHFSSNRARALRTTGEILLHAIPTIYDSERTVQTVRPDGSRVVTVINSDEKTDLSVGTYTVDIDTGPNFGTKRQEAVESMLALGNNYPAAMPLIADILVGNMDWVGSKEIAARLRAAVPADVLSASADDSADDAATLVPILKQQIKQASDNIKALNAHAEQVENELKLAKEELHLSKLDKSIDVSKAEKDYEIKLKQIDLQTKQTNLEVELEIAKLEFEKRKLDLQERQMSINATLEGVEMMNNLHDREVAHIDKITAIPSDDNVSVSVEQVGGDIARNGI